MQSNTAVKFAPIITGEKKIEISLKDDQATLKLSIWNEDLGWCGQKTLSLDSEMLDELQTVISAARIKLKSKSLAEMPEDIAPENSARVLLFPQFV